MAGGCNVHYGIPQVDEDVGEQFSAIVFIFRKHDNFSVNSYSNSAGFIFLHSSHVMYHSESLSFTGR